MTSTCSNTCTYSFDGFCDDGGIGSETSLCQYATDCIDCGIRAGAPPPAPPPQQATTMVSVIWVMLIVIVGALALPLLMIMCRSMMASQSNMSQLTAARARRGAPRRDFTIRNFFSGYGSSPSLIENEGVVVSPVFIQAIEQKKKATGAQYKAGLVAEAKAELAAAAEKKKAKAMQKTGGEVTLGDGMELAEVDDAERATAAKPAMDRGYSDGARGDVVASEI